MYCVCLSIYILFVFVFQVNVHFCATSAASPLQTPACWPDTDAGTAGSSLTAAQLVGQHSPTRVPSGTTPIVTRGWSCTSAMNAGCPSPPPVSWQSIGGYIWACDPSPASTAGPLSHEHRTWRITRSFTWGKNRWGVPGNTHASTARLCTRIIGTLHATCVFTRARSLTHAAIVMLPLLSQGTWRSTAGYTAVRSLSRVSTAMPALGMPVAWPCIFAHTAVRDLTSVSTATLPSFLQVNLHLMCEAGTSQSLLMSASHSSKH